MAMLTKTVTPPMLFNGKNSLYMYFPVLLNGLSGQLNIISIVLEFKWIEVLGNFV